MQLGSPPKAIARRYRNDPGLQHSVVNETMYYNELTSTLMQMFPDMGIVEIIEARREFYESHGVTMFEVMAAEYDNGRSGKR